MRKRPLGKRYANVRAEGKLGKRKLRARAKMLKTLSVLAFFFVGMHLVASLVGWQLWNNIRAYFVLSSAGAGLTYYWCAIKIFVLFFAIPFSTFYFSLIHFIHLPCGPTPPPCLGLIVGLID